MIYFSDSNFSTDFNIQNLDANVILLEKKERHLNIKSAPARAYFNTNFPDKQVKLSSFKVAFLGLYPDLKKPNQAPENFPLEAFWGLSVYPHFNKKCTKVTRRLTSAFDSFPSEEINDIIKPANVVIDQARINFAYRNKKSTTKIVTSDF